MTWFDYAALGVLGLSLTLGLWRGLIREVFALAAWVAALALAVMFSEAAASVIPVGFATPLVRTVIAFLVIFVAVLLAVAFGGILLAKAFRAAGLGLVDRTLGGAFGFARGALILLMAVLVAGLTPLPAEPAWRQSVLAGPLETAVIALKPWLPDRLAERLHYRSGT